MDDCDLTSLLFGVGKAVTLKKVQRDTRFKGLAAAFNRNRRKYE